jgi:sugar lactone lactonase YvrE
MNQLIVLDPTGTQLPGSFTVTQITNVAFGGPQNKTLFITSFGDNRGQLRSVDLEVPGLPF